METLNDIFTEFRLNDRAEELAIRFNNGYQVFVNKDEEERFYDYQIFDEQGKTVRQDLGVHENYIEAYINVGDEIERWKIF